MDHGGVSGRRLHWRSALDVLTSAVMISAAVTLVWLQYSARGTSVRPELKIPAEPVSIENASTKGSPSAPVVIIAFADFECPFCARFARDVLPHLERDYIASGQVQFVFRHLPLSIHPNAERAARAAECAAAQNRFWPYHDGLFTKGSQLTDTRLRDLASSLAMDGPLFDRCLEEPSTSLAIARDTEWAKGLGFTSTPSFLLGTRLSDGRVQVLRAFSGALPLEDFRAEIDGVTNPRLTGWFGRLLAIVWSSDQVARYSPAESLIESVTARSGRSLR